jgi:ribosomal protein S18 acetylase RimI-like enzyme
MKIDYDIWLSNEFGYDVFRITMSAQNESMSVPEVLSDAFFKSSQGRSAFFFAKVPTESVDQVQLLASLGFDVVDVNVTFERKPAKVAQQEEGRALVLRDVLPEDHKAVLDIASACFRYSRFHLDPKIPDGIANRIKRSWVHGYTQKTRGERMLVGLLDGSPVGFLAVLKTVGQDRSARVVDLIGVANDNKRRGIGTDLMSFFINEYSGKCDLLQAGTQAANISSIRLYETSGFRISSTAYVLHGHMRNGEFQ